MGARFEDKVVWITGGGSGIGRELALEFARNGASVAVSGRREDRLEEVVSEVEALGRPAFAVACDVADEASVAAAVEAVVGRFGRLDVAVANAGFAVAGRIDKLDADDWRRQLDVNVVGVAMTARYCVPHLEATGGRLAIVGSISGVVSIANNGPYSASKFAVRSIAQTLSIELAPKGISVTLIQPGFVKSEIAQVDNEGRYNPERKDRRPANLMWETDRAARVMVRAIAARKREFTFTGHGKVVAFLAQHMPSAVNAALRRAATKKARSRG